MSILRWSLAVVFVVAGVVVAIRVTGRSADAERDRSAPAPETAASERGADEEGGETDLVSSLALEQIDLDVKDTLEALERAFEARDAEAAVSALPEDFEGALDTRWQAAPPPGEIVETHRAAEPAALAGREAFAEGLRRTFAEFPSIHDSFFKVKEYQEVHDDRIHAKVKQDFRAGREDGSLYQDFAVWSMDMRRPEGGKWEIHRAKRISRHEIVAAAPLFREVTRSAGLFVTEPPERAIRGVDNIFRRESDFANYDYGGVCVYDVDVDGDPDIFMPNAYGPCKLFINGGDGRFTEEASARGLTAATGMRGAVFGDTDNDGDPDLYVCRSIFHHPGVSHQSNLYYENLGEGRFRDRTIEAGLRKTTPSMSATFLDHDLDGDLDLFVACYGIGAINDQIAADNGYPCLLYRNEGDGTFRDVSREAGVAEETYWSYAVAVVDFDRDLDPDIYVANDYGPNQFYINQGDGTFRDRAEALGVVDVGNGMGASFIDRNADGTWDLYVTNMQSGTGQRVLSKMKHLVDERTFRNLWKLTLGNTFFQSDPEGKLASVAADLGIANCQWAWHGDFADFDADADLDLVVLNGYYSGVQAKDC